MKYCSYFTLLLTCGLLITERTEAQNFGGTPTGIKWRQLQSGEIRVIYPTGLDSSACRIASVIQTLAKDSSHVLGGKKQKISIVLQAQNTLSNGYVSLGPWRSEFYVNAPQDPFNLGSQQWIDNLAIHEYRHVQQFSNFNVGVSKLIKSIFGQQGQALANNTSVPNWFFEGDAVWSETAFSQQGRGRIPSFFNAYKSLYADQKKYNFMKLRNGSLKSFVPSHYELGYLLIAYGKEKYGNSIWRNTAKDAAAFKHLFYPMQRSIKAHTGLQYSSFVENAFDYFNKQWKTEFDNADSVHWIVKNTGKADVVHYQYPYPAVDGSIIVLKTSYSHLPQFVKILPNATEERLGIKAIGYDDYFSYKNNRIIYTAWQPDIRWGNKEYSNICLLNLLTKTTKIISKKARYFSPDINNDGNRIVTVYANPLEGCQLHLLDGDGKLLTQWTADSNYFYSHPKFMGNGNVVVATRLKNGYMGWLLWNPQNGQSQWLTKPVNCIIGFPVVSNDTLYYSGSAGNSDGIYALNFTDLQPALLAAFPTGIYQGYKINGKLLASFFTSNGSRIGTIDCLSKKYEMPSGAAYTLNNLYVPNTISNGKNVLDSASGHFTYTKYRKSFQLLNFHSLQPKISQTEYTLSALGENILNTLYSTVSYTYNTNEKTHSLGINETFGGWYLQPFLNASVTMNRPLALNADTLLHFHQSSGGFGLQLPLNLSKGKYYRYLSMYGSINVQNINWVGFAKTVYGNRHLNYYNAHLYYSSQIQRAVQHIYPHFAYNLALDYKQSINKYLGHQFLAQANMYLPGFLHSHSLVLNGAYQRRDTLRQIPFPNSFPFSRGYGAINYPRMYRISANYHFPLFYPDFGFGQMLYFNRIRMNVFYDYTRCKSIRTGKFFPFSSTGSEVYFDTRWWNQLPVTFGIRYSRLLNNYAGTNARNQWEIILPINLLER